MYDRVIMDKMFDVLVNVSLWFVKGKVFVWKNKMIIWFIYLFIIVMLWLVILVMYRIIFNWSKFEKCSLLRKKSIKELW